MNNKWSSNNNFFQNVVGWEYEGKVDKHASQKGTSSQIINDYILQALIIINACKILLLKGYMPPAKSHIFNWISFYFLHVS